VPIFAHKSGNANSAALACNLRQGSARGVMNWPRAFFNRCKHSNAAHRTEGPVPEARAMRFNQRVRVSRLLSAIERPQKGEACPAAAQPFRSACPFLRTDFLRSARAWASLIAANHRSKVFDDSFSSG